MLMWYQNIKTGFVFESKTEITGEDWVKLNPQPNVSEDTKPKKRVKRDK